VKTAATKDVPWVVSARAAERSSLLVTSVTVTSTLTPMSQSAFANLRPLSRRLVDKDAVHSPIFVFAAVAPRVPKEVTAPVKKAWAIRLGFSVVPQIVSWVMSSGSESLEETTEETTYGTGAAAEESVSVSVSVVLVSVLSDVDELLAELSDVDVDELLAELSDVDVDVDELLAELSDVDVDELSDVSVLLSSDVDVDELSDVSVLLVSSASWLDKILSSNSSTVFGSLAKSCLAKMKKLVSGAEAAAVTANFLMTSQKKN